MPFVNAAWGVRLADYSADIVYVGHADDPPNGWWIPSFYVAVLLSLWVAGLIVIFIKRREPAQGGFSRGAEVAICTVSLASLSSRKLLTN